MTKARDLANLISTGNPLSDGAVSVAEVTGAAPLASPTFTGDVTLPDKIVHTGDTDTAIRFNATDEVSVETGGARRALFNNNGLAVTGFMSATSGAIVQSASGQEGVQLIYNENGGEISLYGTSGNTKTLIDFLDNNDDGNGLARMLNLGAGTDGMQIGVANAANTGGISLTTGNNTQRFFVGSSGQLGIGTSPTYGTSGQVLTSGGSGAAPTWADAGGGTHSYITKIEVTTRNSSTLTMGSSYITSAYNDYYWELIVPANGWVGNDDYLEINITLQYNSGSYSNPYSGKLYFFKTNGSVVNEGSGQRIADGAKRYSSGSGGNQVQVYHFKGTIVRTQDLDVGARVMSEGTYFHNSNDYVRTLHTGTWFADGTASYKITGLRMATGSPDFPVGTKLYLYGINRS